MTTVLYVESGSGNGGSATCLANLVCRLDRQRFRPIVAYYGEGVGIVRIRDAGVDTVRLRPGGRTWQLIRLIRRSRAALIHNNNEIYSQISTMLAATLTRVPCVCSLRATRPLTRRERVWVPVVRRFIAVSDATKHAYVAAGIPSHRIQTVLDGIDLERFSSAPRERGVCPPGLALDPTRLTVGLVSRLIPEKGIEEFLRAAREVVDRYPAVQFVIVGGDTAPDGRHLRRWHALTAELALAHYVIFTGWRQDLPAITPCFDVAAQASKYWEGWGMSLLEAMACGKPVVATRIGAVPEVVDDGTTGILVEPGDVHALARALLVLLTDAALRRRMGEAGRRRVEARFDQAQLVQAMERLYTDVLNGARR